MENVLFKAKFPKVTLAKETKLELVLPEGTSFEKIAEIARFKGGEVFVQFGNPQMAMNFVPSHGSGNRMVATIDGQGVVESASRTGEEEEEAESVLVQDGDGDGEEQKEVNFYDEDPNHDPVPEEDENQDLELPADEDPSDEETEVDVDQDELEAYILSERPRFDDIPFDLPEMLRRRRENGEKWMDLAKEAGISSTKLQQFWNVYKKRVKKQIIEIKGAA